METTRALEEQESQRIPYELVGLLAVAAEGFQTHWPEIEKLVGDLVRLGRAQ